MDHGETGEHFTEGLHKIDAEIIDKNNILKPDGLILIDDVFTEFHHKKYGKGEQSIPYLISHGYKPIMMEYQWVFAPVTKLT